MNKLIGLLTIGLISVAGCTTSPVENVDYFILSNGDIPNSTQARTQQKAKILVDKVSLPSYLDTSNMAMQLNDHQLYYSKQHFWAEPLKIGIVNALVEDLNGDDAKHHYVDSIDDIAEGFVGPQNFFIHVIGGDHHVRVVQQHFTQCAQLRHGV